MRNFSISDEFTTADIGLRISGDSLEELFLAGAEGLVNITGILDASPETTFVEKSVHLSAGDCNQLLVDWLSELIYLFDAEKMIFVSANIGITTGDRFTLEGRLKLRQFIPATDNVEHDIKAVTYYKMNITRKDDIYQTAVVFDL